MAMMLAMSHASGVAEYYPAPGLVLVRQPIAVAATLGRRGALGDRRMKLGVAHWILADQRAPAVDTRCYFRFATLLPNRASSAAPKFVLRTGFDAVVLLLPIAPFVASTAARTSLC